jgi:hypothetical protein
VTDIKNPKLLWAKGMLFLLIGLVSSTLLFLEMPSLKVAFLLHGREKRTANRYTTISGGPSRTSWTSRSMAPSGVWIVSRYLPRNPRRRSGLRGP